MKLNDKDTTMLLSWSDFLERALRDSLYTLHLFNTNPLPNS
jgi:hypothetical protein